MDSLERDSHGAPGRTHAFSGEAPGGWRRVLLRMGHRKAVLTITAVSVALSVLVTALVSFLLGHREQLAMDLLVAVTVPLIVAPFVSHHAIGLVFEVEQAREQLHRAAIRDSLTQLYNRRFFLSRLDTEIERARRTQQSLSLLLIDVDHFKSINDTYGHATGDDVLERLAALLIDAMRPYDLVARYGGEEFVALMPGADLVHAEAAAERIRLAVERMRVDWPSAAGGTDRGVTASVGATSLGGWEERAADLLARADRAMYAAKNGGRNRCVALPPPGLPARV